MYEIYVIISALCFSTTGVWTAFIANENCPATMQSLLRVLFMALATALIMLIKKESFKVTAKQLKASAVFGSIGLTGTFIFYASAVNEMSVGPTALVHYSYPILVAIASAVLYKEKITKGTIIAAVLMVIGMVLSNGGGTMTLKGTLYAFITAITFGTNVIAQDHSALKEIEPIKMMFYNSLFASISCFIITLFTNTFTTQISLNVIGSMACAGIFTELLGATFLAKGARGIGANKAAFLAILELVFSYIWDFLFFHASVTPLSIIGIIFILVSFIFTLIKPKSNM